MKVVYSYINTNHPDNISLDTLYLGITSAIFANNLYGGSTLTSNKLLIDKLKKLDLPFTDYEVVEEYNADYSLPFITKLKTYSQQKQPYIHLDLDLILLEQLPGMLPNYPVRFSHRDIELNWGYEDIYTVFNAYLKPAYDFDIKYGNQFLKDLKLSDTPNMGIVQCLDYEVMKYATDKALKVYEQNKSYFDNNWYTGCFLEQGLIHKFLLEDSSTYRDMVLDNSHYAFNKSIVILSNTDKERVYIEERYRNNQLSFENINQVLDNYFFNNLPAAHFVGGSKNSETIQFIILHYLAKQLGISTLEKINTCFGGSESNMLDKFKRLG